MKRNLNIRKLHLLSSTSYGAVVFKEPLEDDPLSRPLVPFKWPAIHFIWLLAYPLASRWLPTAVRHPIVFSTRNTRCWLPPECKSPNSPPSRSLSFTTTGTVAKSVSFATLWNAGLSTDRTDRDVVTFPGHAHAPHQHRTANERQICSLSDGLR